MVFIEIELDGYSIGEIKFELFKHRLPKTCENFR